MRSKIAGLVLGLGLVTAAIVPCVACPFQDQASATQQQTAQAQPQQGSQTSTQ